MVWMELEESFVLPLGLPRHRQRKEKKKCRDLAGDDLVVEFFSGRLAIFSGKLKTRLLKLTRGRYLAGTFVLRMRTYTWQTSLLLMHTFCFIALRSLRSSFIATNNFRSNPSPSISQLIDTGITPSRWVNDRQECHLYCTPLFYWHAPTSRRDFAVQRR